MSAVFASGAATFRADDGDASSSGKASNRSADVDEGAAAGAVFALLG